MAKMHCTHGEGHVVTLPKGYGPEDLTCKEHGGRLISGMQLRARKSGGRRADRPEPEVEANSRFSKLVREWPCWFRSRREGHECWGRKDPHHLIPADWIRSTFSFLDEIALLDILFNPILGSPLCRTGHEAVEACSDYIYRDELDPELIEYCQKIDRRYADRNIPSMLERLYSESPERAT